jgi:hypothetical protein
LLLLPVSHLHDHREGPAARHSKPAYPPPSPRAILIYIAFTAVIILEEAHVAGRPFSTDDFFRLREPTFRVPMHLSPDGRLLSLTNWSRSHGTPERDQSFTPESLTRVKQLALFFLLRYP